MDRNAASLHRFRDPRAGVELLLLVRRELADVARRLAAVLFSLGFERAGALVLLALLSATLARLT